MKMKKIICLVLSLMFVVVLFTSCGASKPESIAKEMVKAYLKPNIEKCCSYMLVDINKVIEAAAEEEDMTVKEALEEAGYSSMKEMWKELNEEVADNFEDTYGKYKYEIRNVKADKYTSKELKSFKENYEDDETFSQLDIDVDKISEISSVEAKVRIKGEDESKNVTYTFIMAKYKGKWKVVTASGMNLFMPF